MIVADTNIMAYLIIGGAQTPLAEAALQRDPLWAVPHLWRSEFRNILATHLRQGLMTLAKANELMGDAEALLSRGEHDVSSEEVLGLASASRCTAYDCEYVALAYRLGVPLVTTDAQLLRAFPGVAVALSAFARGD